MTTRNIYSDLTTNFNIHPTRGDVTLLSDEVAVKRSIINLMFTEPYERFFRPNIGAGLKAYLFDNISLDTEFMIKEKIIETIRNYEPRANVINVSVTANADENMYVASIIFSVLNSINPVTLEVILRRVR
jgi:phage baseplate assembly protein W